MMVEKSQGQHYILVILHLAYYTRSSLISQERIGTPRGLTGLDQWWLDGLGYISRKPWDISSKDSIFAIFHVVFESDIL